MEKRCIVIPAVKKNAVIPDQLVKRLAGTTLIERAIDTARAVVAGKDVCVVTDSQEICLVCERAGVGFWSNKDLHFKTFDIVSEMRGALSELAGRYEHCIVLRASCPLLTWVDVEDAWRSYLDSGADALVTVKKIRQRIWGLKGERISHFLEEESGQSEVVVESRALIIFRSRAVLDAWEKGGGRLGMDNVVPYFLDDRSIEIQSYQDWWICEHLLQRRHVVFVVAGWPAIGMGHIYRALMLAHEISDHKITFVCTRESELAVESVAKKDYRSVRQQEEPLWKTVLSLRPDLVVNDILNTDAAYVEHLKEAGVKVVNFEDEGAGAPLADLVVNALYDEREGGRSRLCGPSYFCLRDEFVDAQRNVFRKRIGTVLVTFGGTDQHDSSRRVLDLIEPECRRLGIAIRVVAGPGYAHKQEMERRIRELDNPLVRFEWATNVMSRMMEGADLCVCSAGRTVYELAHMRVPALVIATHDREARHTFARIRNGFAFLGVAAKISDDKIFRCFRALLRDEVRERLFRRMERLDFTQNKERVVRRMLALLDGEEQRAR